MKKLLIAMLVLQVANAQAIERISQDGETELPTKAASEPGAPKRPPALPGETLKLNLLPVSAPASAVSIAQPSVETVTAKPSGFPDKDAKNKAQEKAAAKPVPQKPNPNIALYRKLDELRSQNAILAEALKNAQLQNDINKLDKPAPGQINSALIGTMMQPLPQQSAQVQMVSGSEGHLKALIVLPTGGKITAKTGTNIPGVGTVKSITLNEVAVSNRGEIIILPFVGETLNFPPLNPEAR